jgi:branched-chain amino acid transport system ATP-binding protein
VLDARNVTFSYGRVRALSDASIAVAPGELVALLGSNGAGKTTTLRLLSGLLPPSTGTVTLDGEDLTGQPAERFAALRVGHVPEGRGIFPRLTVEQNLIVGLYPRRRERPNRKAEIGWVLELFPALRDRSRQQAGSLSGGEQQMLALARAMMSRPRILLIDEPSHGLAPNIAADLFYLFEGLREAGLGVLVVEQYADLVLGIADRVYVLEKGRITYDGGPAPLTKSRKRLEDAYLGRTR